MPIGGTQGRAMKAITIKQPWAWASGVVATVHGLDAGDYALESDCTKKGVTGRGNYGVAFSIERKSLDDFLGLLTEQGGQRTVTVA
jgi:ERCC4-type nuclease